MHQSIKLFVGAALLSGSALASVPVAQAADTTTDKDTTVYLQAPGPTIHALDCGGTTGTHGCGPGWFWRDGWRGWNCYPC